VSRSPLGLPDGRDAGPEGLRDERPSINFHWPQSPNPEANPTALRLPDFIIGGAPRSGTTWLYELLDRHPDVYMARPLKPEPKFFLVDHVYERGLNFYAATWFAGAGDARLAGEKSTDYLESAAAAERMARDLPRVKLVFILREPADRAYSNFVWSRMNGLETEDFPTALRLEIEREQELPERLKFARPFSYFSRGLYADLLQPYLQRFPRGQMLILRFEDIVIRPAALAERLHRFLGVSPRPADAEGLGVINPSNKDIATLDETVRRDLLERYTEPNRRLTALLGPEFEPWQT
jgi:Sulfotransferase domain